MIQYYLFDEKNNYLSTNIYAYQPINSTTIAPTVNTYFALWNGTNWADKRSDLEIQQQNQLSQMQDFLTKKKADGEVYYNEIELALTIVLAGLPIQSLIPVNHEIETLIKPIINEIKMGDWFNAYMKLWITEDYTRPESNLLKQTFDNIKVRVKQYFETNYPR